MKTIKEYAESRQKSERAVYKQLQAKKNIIRLEGHIITEAGKKYLDEVAISILDESSKTSPAIIVESVDKQQTEDLKAENEALQAELSHLKDKYMELFENTSKAITESSKHVLELSDKVLLLEDTQKDTSTQLTRAQSDNAYLSNQLASFQQQNEMLNAQIIQVNNQLTLKEAALEKAQKRWWKFWK